jgi:GNAT superfamily N-acetyltransferase
MQFTTNLPGFEIRWAEKTDISLIRTLIFEIAEYEKLSHEVKTQEADLEKYIFGEDKIAEVLLGFFEGQAVGFALFFHNFSTFVGKPGIYLEDLFIREKYRGKGYGKALLTLLARIAVERGCGRLEWSVLDWNKPALDFYQSLGAKIMDEWLINRVTGESLTKMGQMFSGEISE